MYKIVVTLIDTLSGAGAIHETLLPFLLQKNTLFLKDSLPSLLLQGQPTAIFEEQPATLPSETTGRNCTITPSLLPLLPLLPCYHHVTATLNCYQHYLILPVTVCYLCYHCYLATRTTSYCLYCNATTATTATLLPTLPHTTYVTLCYH